MNKQLPPYFREYLDQKFENVTLEIKELKEVLLGNSKEGLVTKVEKHDKWIAEFTGKIAVISVIIGSIGAFVFSIIREVLADFFIKIK